MNPTGKRVFIVLDKPKTEEEKKGVIVSPKKVVKPTTGVIAKIGKDVDESIYGIGKKVFLGSFYPEEQDVCGELYVILEEDKIIAVE